MNLVSLESLKIFCDVVRQKSFSRGATMNAVSQSAASQTILQIEKRLGVRLIDRSKRPLTLTREGRLYYEECRSLLERYMAVEDRIRVRHSDEINRVNVASIYSVVLYDMNQYVQRFMERHPHGQVRFHYLHPDDVCDSVLNDEADLGLVSFPRTRRELEIIPWRNEPMVLVCSPAHRFSRLKQVTVEQMNGVDFVAFDPALAIRRHIDRFLRQRHVEVNVVMAFDNIEFMKRGIESSDAVSILPEPTVRSEVNNGSLRIVPVPRLDLVRSLCIIHRRKRILTPAILNFIRILKESEADWKAARRLWKPKVNERVKE
jgi:DNA-binding transcriptional LysR family regulator